MKLLFTILILTGVAYGQVAPAPTEVTYKATGIYSVLTDSNFTELSRKPLGNNVRVVYDTFFKSYKIYSTNEKGGNNLIDLKFFGTTSTPGITSMRDRKNNDEYYAFVITGGLLRLLMGETVDRYPICWFYIEGLEKLE